MPRKPKPEKPSAEILAPIPADILDQIVRDGPLTAAEVASPQRAGHVRARRLGASVSDDCRGVAACLGARVIPFFAFPPQIRGVIYTTNALESVHAQLRKIIKTRGHFPNGDAATKLI